MGLQQGSADYENEVTKEAASERGRLAVASPPVEGWLRSFRFSPRKIDLTSTQKTICQFIACGLSDKEIAYLLGIGCSTVKAHNTKILRMLGLFRRTQLVRFVFETGDFDPSIAEAEVKRRSIASRRQPRQCFSSRFKGESGRQF